MKEVETLATSLKILQEEIEDPESILMRAGEHRIRTVNELVDSIFLTLKQLEKTAKKYEILGVDTGSKRHQVWTKFKWSIDSPAVDGLRGKVSACTRMLN